MKKLLLLLLLSLLPIQSLADLSDHPGNPIYWAENTGPGTGSTWPAIVAIIVFFALMPLIPKLCGLLDKILPDSDSDWRMYVWLVGAILIVVGVYGSVFTILLPILFKF
jgi:hypothetical protein